MSEQDPFNNPEAQDVQAGYQENRRLFRPEGYAEISTQTTPENVMHYTRQLTAGDVRRWVESGRQPNTYLIENVIRQNDDRRAQLLVSIPLGRSGATEADESAGLIAGNHYMKMPIEQQMELDAIEEDNPDRIVKSVTQRNGRTVQVLEVDGQEIGLYGKVGKVEFIGVSVTEEEAAQRREELSAALEQSVREVEAWSALLGKTQEQSVFSGDVKAYTVDAFTRLGSVAMDARHYAEIFNLPPTERGFAPLGRKIEAAHSALRDVATGRAVADLTFVNEDGTQFTRRMVLPNPYAMPKNRGLRDVVMSYVESRVSTETPDMIDGSNGALQRLKQSDDQMAVNAAWVLFDHFDEDAEYAWASGDDGRGVTMDSLVPVDVVDAKSEMAYNDKAKLIHVSARRRSEYRGDPNGRRGEAIRKYPRKAGAPSTLDVLPKLSSHFLDIVPVEVVAKNSTGEDKKIAVTIDQRAYGRKNRDGDREIFESNNKRYSKVKQNGELFVYEVVGLGDRSLWDNVQLLVDGQVFDTDALGAVAAVDTTRMTNAQVLLMDVQGVDLVMGAPTNAHKIPFGLQSFYAYKGLYEQFTRTDYATQLKEVLDGDLLRGMNKSVSSALAMIARTYEIDKTTMAKLDEYLRVAFLGGLVSSVTKSVGTEAIKETRSEQESRVQVPFAQAQQKSVIDDVLEVSQRTGFLGQKVVTTGRESKIVYENEKVPELLNTMVQERHVPSPFESHGWFTESELDQLRPLYPHISH